MSSLAPHCHMGLELFAKDKEDFKTLLKEASKHKMQEDSLIERLQNLSAQLAWIKYI